MKSPSSWKAFGMAILVAVVASVIGGLVIRAITKNGKLLGFAEIDGALAPFDGEDE